MKNNVQKDNLSRRFIIDNLLGIHARPAAKIAKTVESAKKNVWISTQTNKVDARNIIDILSLGASNGTSVVFEIETPDDLCILDRLSQLFKSQFGEVNKNND